MARILIIIPYQFYPPIGGGPLRCFYLLRSLATAHEVYVLTTQPAFSFRKNETTPTFPANVNVISIAGAEKMRTVLNKVVPARVADGIHTRWLNKSFTSKRSEFILKSYPLLKHINGKVQFDVVLYENLESFAWLRPFWNNKRSRPLQLLDAHNVDSRLWLEQSKTEDSQKAKQYAANALITEKKLAKCTDFVFACSALDLDILQQLNKGALQGMVVPNGVDIELKSFDTSPAKSGIKDIIFCGTLSYFPNREGLLWFYETVFPLLKEMEPGINLTVVGQVVDEQPFANLKADNSVYFIGTVPDVQPYHHRCSVAIVPLLSGSGTRLKILEAMSMGNPVVTTSKGAEGIAYEENRHLLLADDPLKFAQQISRLLSESRLFEEVRHEALTLVQSLYDWRKIGKQMSDKIESLIS